MLNAPFTCSWSFLLHSLCSYLWPADHSAQLGRRVTDSLGYSDGNSGIGVHRRILRKERERRNSVIKLQLKPSKQREELSCSKKQIHLADLTLHSLYLFGLGRFTSPFGDSSSPSMLEYFVLTAPVPKTRSFYLKLSSCQPWCCLFPESRPKRNPNDGQEGPVLRLDRRQRQVMSLPSEAGGFPCASWRCHEHWD